MITFLWLGVFLSGFIAGTKLYLPEGFKRSSDNVKEEVEIPTSDPAPADVGSKFIAVSDLDEVNGFFWFVFEIYIIIIKHIPSVGKEKTKNIVYSLYE